MNFIIIILGTLYFIFVISVWVYAFYQLFKVIKEEKWFSDRCECGGRFWPYDDKKDFCDRCGRSR